MDNNRHHYIDFLRVIAILMMFVFHVNMIFVAGDDWHVNDASASNTLMEVNYWMSSFRMPLLFLVSGFVSVLLLEKMGWRQFVLQRFRRLLIPTAVWTFLLVAPQIYFERQLQEATFNYPEFYRTFLTLEWYPEGNFHWLHLWFIPYLFFYNVLSIPVAAYLNHDSVRAPLDRWFRQSYSLPLVILLAILPYTLLALHFPTTYDLVNDWARHAFFITFVLAGTLLCKLPTLLQRIEHERLTYLRVALLLTVSINTMRWNGWEPYDVYSDWMTRPQTHLFIVLLTLHAWTWVLVCLGYGRKYLNSGSKLLTNSNQAVYPFYILHQTVIVVVGYYVVQTPDSPPFKYVFLLLVCFAICVLLYHTLIRPYSFMRFLFGMKPAPKVDRTD